MKKLFGFLVLIVMSSGVSQAALLATWTFTGGSVAGTVDPLSEGLGGTASNFTNFGTPPATNPTLTTSSTGRPFYGINGAVSSAAWRTNYIFNPVDTDNGETVFTQVDTTKGNKFAYTSTRPTKDLIIQNLQVNLAIASETANAPAAFSSAAVMVYTSVDNGAFTYSGQVTNISTAAQQVTVPLSLVLSPGKKIEFAFSYVGSASNASFSAARNFRFTMDDLKINGIERVDVVPEPSSMAIFGLSVAGLVARRRMKNRS